MSPAQHALYYSEPKIEVCSILYAFRYWTFLTDVFCSRLLVCDPNYLGNNFLHLSATQPVVRPSKRWSQSWSERPTGKFIPWNDDGRRIKGREGTCMNYEPARIYPAWIPPLELRIFKLIKRRYLYLNNCLILYYIYRTSITQISGFCTHHLSIWFMIGSL